MTIDINDWWGVSVTHGAKIGPKRWRATARVFRRDNLIVVEEFEGYGTTMNTSDDDALHQARRFVLAQGQPRDWQAA